MTEILILVALVAFMFRGKDLLKRYPEHVRTMTCVLAWIFVTFLCWGAWHIVLLVLDIFSHKFAFISILKLGAILMGIAYIHQYVITFTEAGTTERAWYCFKQMLMMQFEIRQPADAYTHRRKEPL